MYKGHEQVVQIPGEVALHGVMYRCSDDLHPTWGLVVCDPFAEEKKCAHRVMVEAARRFCQASIGCLRFDYRGCGDSPGEFGEATPEVWVDDIIAAVAYARELLEVQVLGLLGLRLGATLALDALAGGAAADYLVLWEPILQGRQYVAQNLRRSQIKAMLTDQQSFDPAAVRLQQEAGSFDFDGYHVSAEMRQQLEAINLLEMSPEPPRPTLVVNITSREQPGGDYQALAERWGGEVMALRQEPFWNRIGLSEAGPLVEATELWLAEQQAHWLMQGTLNASDEPEATDEGQ